MAVIIGTSGYDYPEWVGADRFYPPGLKGQRGDWLTYYASIFPLIELNFTYYGEISPGQLEKMLKKTDPSRGIYLLEGSFAPRKDFKFVVKTYSTLTHDVGKNWTSQAEKFKADVAPLSDSGKLMGVLAQFPSRFHLDERALVYVAALADALKPLQLIVEFRHIDWFAAGPKQKLAESGVVVCGVDAPQEAKLPRVLAEELDQTPAAIGPRFKYLRLHGRREGFWWSGDAGSRYEYSYPDELLKQLAQRLLKAQVSNIAVLFNNHRHADATKNAVRLQEILDEMLAS